MALVYLVKIFDEILQFSVIYVFAQEFLKASLQLLLVHLSITCVVSASRSHPTIRWQIILTVVKVPDEPSH